ncbi:uncharacterized protein LTR77_005601 [Saxophila tyrrhenica]|uniref:Rab-GAP TBC domain-containing protein n=1 Tax=Saxophila tyrrhenica TaxID=1690608 RepID=A0AAV9PBY4_9PEZI|nr:hypothetical protein LTR77_005601 [Saxophila tyrrhenica]
MQEELPSYYYTSTDWPLDHYHAVAAALREVMETPAVPTSSRTFPEPHLPLRRASARTLQQQQQAKQRGAPTPLWVERQQGVRGFSPSPVQAMPRVDNVQASSEHAFAGREEGRRRFRPPLGVGNMARPGGMVDGGERRQYIERPATAEVEDDGSKPPSSPLLSPPGTPRSQQQKLRSSKSLGDGLRGWKNRFSAPNKKAPQEAERDTMYSVPVMRPSRTPNEEVRSSFRSALTSSSSYMNTSSIHTDYSSMTGNSSHSDFVKIYPNWPEGDHEDLRGGDQYGEDVEGMMSVEDAIGMYADGFSSAKHSMDTQGKRSLQTARPTSQPSAAPSPERKKRPDYSHRRSRSAGLLTRVQQYKDDQLAVPSRPETSHHAKTFSKILNGPATSSVDPTAAMATFTASRDRYGFKKASHHVTVEAYDAWNATYTKHLDRRSKKWHALMKSYGLATDKPYRFPPKSDKVKRYVRKGIPPEFRGAAWFWYAGGPGKLAKEPGLYFEVLEHVRNGALSENDREHIERDLNRTFPDNVRFKPDPTTTLDAQAGAGGGVATTNGNKRKSNRPEPETPIVQALRRVLQAFAVNNPGIGYCQSLNFIAGLLLLFLDGDEEKSFVLLTIITTQHLPGTHGVALEGANIDIAVLMSCIKDSLPAIWAKLDDKGSSALIGAATQALRLPTVSLATTAWFMSLFVGTLPIESVLRVWDCLFFEGSKTLFRIALAIFKLGEKSILGVSDPMEIFQVVQTIPRSMLDVNALMEVCFKRRGGFGHVSQEVIEGRREERRKEVREGVVEVEGRKGWRRLVGRAKTVGPE